MVSKGQKTKKALKTVKASNDPEKFAHKSRSTNPIRNDGLSPSACGKETIFIAEDEAMIRKMVVTALSLHGYATEVAADGAEAIELFREKKDKIALAFIDYTMPKVSGKKVVKEIRALSPDMPIILTSGYTSKCLKDFPQTDQQAISFMNKPYPLPKLLSRIRKMIDD